ncbi:unnamed protein product [Trichobilharzia szidati]|nr:unnamed protein product [Trichobilharzia szidati]
MQLNQSEVITIQAGSLANQVCTHFWNLQEYGFTNKPTTTECEFPFTYQVLFDDSTRKIKPRALAVDVRETVDFGTKLNSQLIPTLFDIPLWNSQVDQVIRSSPQSNGNKHLCSNWTNCLSPSAHRTWCHDDILYKLPVSLQPIPTEFTDDKTDQPNSVVSLSTFTEGQDVYRSGNHVADECDDRIRRLAESCSFVNSFQVVVDAEDGFTGVGIRLLENIVEEFPKAFIFSVPLYHSSALSHMSTRLQKIATVNQLCLINNLESGDFISHGCWLPMDVSELSDHCHVCQKMSVLASVLDTVTTPTKLAYKFGGLNMNSLWSVTGFAQGRNMLTAQAGICCHEKADDQLSSWYNFNPYYNQGKRIAGETVSPQPVLWRQLMSRGVTDSKLMDNLWKMCNNVTNSNDTTSSVKNNNNNNSNNNHVNSNNALGNLHIPSLYTSGLSRLVYTLPEYPLQTTSTRMNQINSSSSSSSAASSASNCQQYPTMRTACIVDVPNTNSYEAKALEKLVKSLLPYKSHPIDTLMELEVWREFLESAQTRLIDAYTTK